MKRKVFVLSLLGIFVISLSGCATGRKQSETEIQGLKSQVSSLESQLQSKDEEINGLREELSNGQGQEQQVGISATKTVTKKMVIGEVKSRPNIKQIQIALQNAGYNPGSIDGRMGKQTKEAIKAFQKANNLSPDGRVGKKTWSLLRDYLSKKVK
jgi:peptidoglycan hydrolase-like protein with peptidoglycan-binding domain